MANPERPPISIVGKNNLGSYNLARLLETLKQGEEQPDWDPLWDSVNSNFPIPFIFIKSKVRSNVNVEIPSILSERLDFDKLSWQIKKIDNFSTLLIGYKSEKSGKVPVEEALATIEIEQRAISGEKNEYGQQVFDPFYFRVAGVDKKQNIIVAATYDHEKDNRLTTLNISMPRSECPDLDNDWDSPDNLRRQLVVPLPTNKTDPYDTAGLITQQMLEAVDLLRNPNPSLRTNALVYRFGKGGACYPGRAPVDYDEIPDTATSREELNRTRSKLLDLTTKLGYYPETKNGMVIVGLEKSAAKRRKTSPWEISVPEFLPNV